MEAAVRKTAKVAKGVAPKSSRVKAVEGVRKVSIESFAGAFLASPIERVEAIRRGIAANVVVQTGKAMNMPSEQLFTILRLPRATVNRKISAKAALSPEMSERILGLRKLIGQVEVMVRESGNPEGFNAAQWVAHWLGEPSPALGGSPPRELMDTVEGQEIVAGLVARMQSGAYA